MLILFKLVLNLALDDKTAARVCENEFFFLSELKDFLAALVLPVIF